MQNIERYRDLTPTDLAEFSSIKMGLETAFLDYQNKGTKIFYRNEFTEGKRGIKINGLVWMGRPEFLDEQIRSKLNDGYTCIKLKVGAIDFEAELALIKKSAESMGHRTLKSGLTPTELSIRRKRWTN